MASSPLVSVIIPVFNGEDFLGDAIRSALEQDHRPLEVLVVNDGSTDGGRTEAIARAFGDRVRYFAKPNGGVATALNLGIGEARGDYVSWLSHDDLYHPRKISRQLEVLRREGDHRTVAYGEFDTLVVETGAIRPGPRSVFLPRRRQDLRFLSSLLLGWIHGCSLLVPRECFAGLGRFREDLRTTQDYDYWFRLLEDGYRFLHVPGAAVTARSHAAQGTRTLGEVHRRETAALYDAAITAHRVAIGELPVGIGLHIFVAFQDRQLAGAAASFVEAWAGASPIRRFAASMMSGAAALRRAWRSRRTRT